MFTLNYDLLLYWALITQGFEDRRFRDGFGDVNGRLEWSDYSGQELLYLHGALHLFQYDDRLEKIRYQRDGPLQTLIDQIIQRIAEGHAPLFVCEGTNEQKKQQIDRSWYLRYCYRQLLALKEPLLIFGHSLGPNDKHILDAIASSGIQNVFVGLYGDPQSEHNRTLVSAAQTLTTAYSRSRISVHYYHAESACIW